MATKNYMINDKWLDLDKQNIVELQSVDGELDSLKVNGSEIVTPSGKITITENGTDIDIAQYALADVSVEGGGSSDFSTAEVTIINNSTTFYGFLEGACLLEDLLGNEKLDIRMEIEEENTYSIPVVLYKNYQDVMLISEEDPPSTDVSVNGNIAITETGYFRVTGNGTITISDRT